MRITTKQWLSFITIGLAGQLAWTIENMYLNVFMYEVAITDPQYIARMVAASAIVATLTTLIMGNVSDRIGRRKVFIAAGYILWGISIILFSQINLSNAARLFPAANAAVAAATLIIIMDCLMTFFGSTANDAAFNAYVTDSTVPDNRGKVESVLAILPLLSMLIVFGALDPLVRSQQWELFFVIIGGVVIAAGVLAIFLVKDTKIEKKNEPFFASLVYGFSPASFRENKKLYFSMGAFCVFSTAVQIFFPYLIIYLSEFLQFDNYALVLAIVLIVASVISILAGPQIDRFGKMAMIYPSVVTMLSGLVGLFFARATVSVTLAGIVMMAGYMMIAASLSALIRDYTPAGQVGVFQGVRMVFTVMLPMIIGPFIGAWLIKSTAGVYEELGQIKNIPTPDIFLIAAFVLIFILVPLYFLGKNQHADKMGKKSES